MISLYDLEEKAFQYMSETGVKPKFVLLDSVSYKNLNKTFAPKEKIELFTDSEQNPPRVISVHLHSNIVVEVLEVNIPRTLFEVVG